MRGSSGKVERLVSKTSAVRGVIGTPQGGKTREVMDGLRPFHLEDTSNYIAFHLARAGVDPSCSDTVSLVSPTPRAGRRLPSAPSCTCSPPLVCAVAHANSVCRAARQLVSKLDERQRKGYVSRITRNPIRKTVEAPKVEALCGSHKMVLGNRYLAVFSGDSRASSTHYVVIGLARFQFKQLRQGK